MLNNAFSKVETMSMTENGKSFIVSTAFDLLEDGQREIVQGLGNSYTFSAYVYYMIVEDGVNSRQTLFALDGVMLPYQLVTVSRVPQFEGNIYSNAQNINVKNLYVQSTLSISMDLPVLTPTAEIVYNAVLGGQTDAHILTLTIDNKVENYLVHVSESSISANTRFNLGGKLSFIEAPDIYELLTFGENIKIFRVNNASSLISHKNEMFKNGVFYNFRLKKFTTNFTNYANNDVFITLKDNVFKYKYTVSELPSREVLPLCLFTNKRETTKRNGAELNASNETLTWKTSEDVIDEKEQIYLYKVVAHVNNVISTDALLRNDIFVYYVEPQEEWIETFKEQCQYDNLLYSTLIMNDTVNIEKTAYFVKGGEETGLSVVPGGTYDQNYTLTATNVIDATIIEVIQ